MQLYMSRHVTELTVQNGSIYCLVRASKTCVSSSRAARVTCKLKERRLTKRKPPTAATQQLVRTSKLIARDARKRGELESAKSHNAKSPPAPATANWLRGRGAMELQLQWRTRRACEVPVFVAQAARPHHSTRSARAQFIPPPPPPPTHTHTATPKTVTAICRPGATAPWK